MGGDLRVGLGLEHMADADELFFELQIVLDDPVVDEGDLTELVEVGVCVEVCRAAVGGPS